jgi:hypothetical protein
MISTFPQKSFCLFAAAALAASGLLSGCGVDVQSLNGPVAMAGKTIRGNVHGGVYPIQNATIRLMETQSNGYGGAAKQLLQTTSDNNGFFTFPDTGWSCDSNQFAYITVTSGYTVPGKINNNVGQIGVIGNCGQFLANTAEIDAVNVYVSELSTIAAAYALRGFISVDNTNAANGQQMINISAPANNNAPSGVCTFTGPVSCVAAGLAHGFENAYNLVDSVNFAGQLPSGQARTTPPTNGFAYVPQPMINTLANILQSCVDSPGGTVASYATYSPGGTNSTHCGDLFYWATPPGGTPPTNTLQVALNMAQYPTNNVVSLFSLQPRAVFFTPTLNQAPNDLSLSIFYLTETFGALTGDLTAPRGLALDSNDDAFVLATAANGTANTETGILGISTNGQVLFAGPVNTTYTNPTSIATDTLDNIWVTNNDATNGALLKANPETGVIAVGTSLAYASGVGVDRNNGVWAITNVLGFSSVQKYNTGALLGGTVLPLLRSSLFAGTLNGVSFDNNQNIWSVNATSTGTNAVAFPNLGTLASPVYPSNMTAGALSTTGGFAVAPGANGEMYFPLSNQLNDAKYNGGMSVNNLGTFTGSSQNGAQYNMPNQAEVDGAGNVFWADTEASGQVFQFVPGANGMVSQGSLNALLPCYPVNNVCYVPAVSNGRGMQIDSTGALWYVADASYFGYSIGVIVQTFGVGAPTWPQLSLGKPGVMPQ